MKSIHISERGQILVLLTFGLIGLLALTALAIDGGNAFADRRNAQNAVDNAVYAASYAWVNNQNYTAAGDSIITKNGYTSNGNATWTYDATAVKCANNADGLMIIVSMNTNVDTYFASVVGWNQLHNKVKAAARACKIGPKIPVFAGNSIFATKTEDCGVGYNFAALGNSGSAQLNLYGGGWGTASDDPTCVNIKGGATTFLANAQGACGGIETAAASAYKLNGINNSCGGSVTYQSSFSKAPGDLKITCAQNAVVTGNTMSPGTYNGTFPPNGVTTLQAGTYCVNGDFNLNAKQSLVGAEVTIVLTNPSSSITWNGTASPQLTAPMSGTNKGLLIYAPPSVSYTNGASIKINGGSDSLLQGTILTQNVPCDYMGDSKSKPPSTSLSLQLICYTTQFNGNNTSNFVYDADSFFKYPEPASVEMLQ